MPNVLWWGRFDPQYSRNRIVGKLFTDSGWQVTTFRPWTSPTGWIEGYGRGLQRPDLIWVPCFRQRDIRSALHWRKKWAVPLVIDPLISAYEKAVFEKRKWSPDAAKAKRLGAWEAGLFKQADLVVADTPLHAQFYQDVLGVHADRLAVLYVGAEDRLFAPRPYPSIEKPYEILFYGSYLHLQGIEVIVQAAHLTRMHNFKWVLLGEGDLKPSIEKQARGIKNIAFEPWIAYRELPDRMSRAHIILGIFGTSRKAGMVIPNKMFQTMALGRPVITRTSAAYPDDLARSDVIGWVPAGQPEALANMVCRWLDTPDRLAVRGKATRDLFEKIFSVSRLRDMLNQILQAKLGLPQETAQPFNIKKEH